MQNLDNVHGDSTEKELRVTLYLDADQAWALAQLVKRATWSDIRACAVDNAEASVMTDAVDIVGKVLADAGISPR